MMVSSKRRIDAGARLVEQDDARIGHQDAAEFQQLALAAGKNARRLAAPAAAGRGIRAGAIAFSALARSSRATAAGRSASWPGCARPTAPAPRSAGSRAASSRRRGAGSGRCGQARAPIAGDAPARRRCRRPSRRISPLRRAGSCPAIRLKSVVLPAPLGPIRPTISPLRHLRARHRQRRSAPPKCFVDGLGLPAYPVPLTRDIASCYHSRSSVHRQPSTTRTDQSHGRCPGRQFRALRPARRGRRRPKGARLYCGAKPGDYFELQGRDAASAGRARDFRSIRWPPCCRCSPPSSATTQPHDWMTSDAEVACPDPNCPSRLRITRARQADDSAMPRRPRFRSAGRSVTLIGIASFGRAMRSPGSSAAAGNSPAAMAPSTAQTAVADLDRLLPRRASPPSTAPTSIPASRSSSATSAPAYLNAHGRGGARGAQGAHQIRARSRHPAGDHAKRHVRSVIEQSLRRLRHGAARSGAVPLVGLCGAGLSSRPRCGSRSCSRRARSTCIGGTNFDTPHTRELLAAGVPLASMQVQYSLLDARPEHGLVAALPRA